MRSCILTLLASTLLLAFATYAADEPATLPGTKPLEGAGDLASTMIDGIDRFLVRKIHEAEAKRASFWDRQLDGPDAFASSNEPNRRRLAKILGLRESGLPTTRMEILGSLRTGPALAEDDTLVVYAVRWEGLQDMHGEGLMLVPKGPNRHLADVVAIPDSTQTPESLCGLTPGVPEASRFPLRLARSGCRVIVPTLVDRDTDNQFIPHREFVHRQSFELGRLVAGYEIIQVRSALRWFRQERAKDGVDRPTGVMGYGDGGMIALYSEATQVNANAVCVSGYFGERSKIWTEPLDRNVFGLLERFGDAEVAAMIAPRTLVIEAAKVPAVEVAPGGKAAPGKIAQPTAEAVRAEAGKAAAMTNGLVGAPSLAVSISGDGLGPFGSPEAVGLFLAALSDRIVAQEPKALPAPTGTLADPVARAWRLRREILRKNAEVLEDSASVRDQYFKALDTSSLDAFSKTIEPFRKKFEEDVIGKFDDPLLPLNARSRKVFDEPKYTGYEVVLDVFPDVFAYGILLVPKGIKPGDKRPVIVCQHGLEGRPSDVADPRVNNPAYNQFAVRLAERGFVTFAPQNPYIFGDRFRTLQRKANPLGKTLFSIIVPQHRQIVAWLKTQDFVDPDRIAFYGLSYGGKSAMRIPALVKEYCLSICSADFNEWVWKNASLAPHSYLWTNEYEIFEWDLGSTFNYAEMATLIAPRPFMVERGHWDNVAPDEKVAHEYAKVRRLYNGRLKIGDRTEIEFFDGPHTIHGVGTFDFLHKHLRWPKP